MNVIRNVIWNTRLHGWSYVKQYAGVAAALGSITLAVGMGVHRTRQNLNRIVARGVLEREHGGRPEYLYVSDPAYEQRIRTHLEEENAWSPGPIVGRWVGGARRAVWRRLIHLSRNGERADREKALEHLARIKHLKVDEWDWTWLSQRLDARSMVWLARNGGRCGKRLTSGVPPLPKASEDVSFYTILASLDPASGAKRACRCLKLFLQEHAERLQEDRRLIEQEPNPSSEKPSDDNELLSCLETALHHFDMTPIPTNKQAVSIEELFVRKGGLAFITKAAYSSDRSLHLAAARLLMKLSDLPHLLPVFHRAGLISVLSAWLEEGDKKDAQLCCMAAGALASFEDGCNELKKKKEIYGPAVQLLYPIHHTHQNPKIDVVFVHGLLGEPFVTWRQRDKTEDTIINKDNIETENINILDDFGRKEKFDIVLRDIPETSKRNSSNILFSSKDELQISSKEIIDLTSHSQCWPRDWLPTDCPDIRVLGVSYDTMMIEWSSNCRGLGNTEQRAHTLSAALKKAGVGTRPVIWVAHSMGGVLVKHMLVQSLESKAKEDQIISDNTKGIVFFSTPHHGARATHALIWPTKEIQDMRQNSKIMKDLHTRWLAGGWKSVCFAENRPTKLLSFPGLSMMLVPPESADDNSGAFYVLPLDHLDICKPATRHSFIYKIIVEMIQHAKNEKCRQDGCKECTKKDNKTYNLQDFLFIMLNVASDFWKILNTQLNFSDKISQKE